MSTRRQVLIGLACAATSMMSWACLPASAGGPPAKLRAEYTFDSIANGTAADVSGRGHPLTLTGNYSQVSGVTSPAVAFAPVSRAETPDKADLNPGTQEFAVSVVFRIPGDTSALTDTPNLAQKGLWNDASQWKMQLKPDIASIQCRFKGASGANLLTSSVKGVDDAQWHTATCWRSGNQVGVIVDGVATTETASIGSISSPRPMFVGAKSLSSATDQFTGDIDYVSVAMGRGSAQASLANAPG